MEKAKLFSIALPSTHQPKITTKSADMERVYEAFVMRMKFRICSKINMLMCRTKARLSLNPSRDLYAKNVFILSTVSLSTRKHELYTFLSYSQVSVFTSFASTGNPNSNIIDADMENVEWKPVDTQQPPFKCLNLDEHLSFINLPESERLTIWNELYEATKTKLF